MFGYELENQEKFERDIAICEKIVEQGSCSGIDCVTDNCPLVDTECKCDVQFSLSRAVAFLNHHKKTSQPEPQPKTNNTKPVHEVLINMIRCRALEGKKKYGTYLQAGNGRDALMDALQESLDMNQYLMQVIMEKETKTFPETIFSKNTIDDQIKHLVSESVEFLHEYFNGNDFEKLIDEATDFCHSFSTLSDINNDICLESMKRVIEKNKKRGYYVDNDNVKV